MTTRTSSMILLATLLAGGAFADETSGRRVYGPMPVESDVRIQPVPEAIVVVPHTDPIRVSVWTDDDRYWLGEEVEIGFRVDQDSFVHVLSTDATGTTRQIFPNPWDRDNFARAGRTYRLPDGPYRFIAEGPRGLETITVIATSAECTWISPHGARGASEADPFPVIEGGPEAVQSRIESEAKAAHDESLKGASRVEPVGPQRIGVVPDPRPRPGYGLARTTIRIVGPATYPLPYRPAPIVEYGTLRVRSTPSRAQAFLDGRFVGYTPLELGLPEGRYDLELQRPGYESWYERVDIDDNDTTTIRAAMEREW